MHVDYRPQTGSPWLIHLTHSFELCHQVTVTSYEIRTPLLNSVSVAITQKTDEMDPGLSDYVHKMSIQ